jgi:hypothetical protein
MAKQLREKAMRVDYQESIERVDVGRQIVWDISVDTGR